MILENHIGALLLLMVIFNFATFLGFMGDREETLLDAIKRGMKISISFFVFFELVYWILIIFFKNKY